MSPIRPLWHTTKVKLKLGILVERQRTHTFADFILELLHIFRPEKTGKFLSQTRHQFGVNLLRHQAIDIAHIERRIFRGRCGHVIDVIMPSIIAPSTYPRQESDPRLLP